MGGAPSLWGPGEALKSEWKPASFYVESCKHLMWGLGQGNKVLCFMFVEDPVTACGEATSSGHLCK